VGCYFFDVGICGCVGLEFGCCWFGLGGGALDWVCVCAGGLIAGLVFRVGWFYCGFFSFSLRFLCFGGWFKLWNWWFVVVLVICVFLVSLGVFWFFGVGLGLFWVIVMCGFGGCSEFFMVFMLS